MWREGSIGIPKKDGGYKIAKYWVMAFDEGSEYGINGGKISKLTIILDGIETLHYDRRWEVKPDESDEATMIAYSIILQEYN